MLRRLLSAAPAVAFLALAFAVPAWAGMGQPSPGQIGMQEAATPVAVEIHKFYDFVNIIIMAIALFVLLLLVYVMWRFSERRQPNPSRTTHNTLLEVAWTVVPILILVAIAIPSFRLLNLQYSFPKPDLTIKTTGYTWYWNYEYPDQGGFTFDSYIDPEAQPRNLAVDNEVIIPVNKVVHLLVTADPDGVIHSWTIPSFGSKVDAVPGRVTATWFKATQKGVFYGQCSELCGKDHSLMPIAVRVVDEQVFTSWADLLKQAAAEKDSKKRKELIKQSKDLVQQAALKDAGADKVADAGTAAQR
jgi:cytochrome c oxidase subunit 2